jgi:TrmH family RNA methyltransferase
LLSKSRLKQYQQLSSKKFRQKYGLFVVEGLKSIQELLKSNWKVETILCTPDFNAEKLDIQSYGLQIIETTEFAKLSNLKSPQGILAIVHMNKNPVHPLGDWEIALDQITDPGNLGTIIRIADWYGISRIVYEKGTVDLYNPKVIQASMASFLRVDALQVEFEQYLRNKTVFAAVLDGQSSRKLPVQKKGVILIGNEASGITEKLLEMIPHVPLRIEGSGQTDSLNAAIATAVICERLVQF